MSTLIICLVVAGTAIALLTRLVTDEMAKPATDAAGNQRATRAAVRDVVRQIDDAPLPVLGDRPPTVLQRIRSGILLVLLLSLVGMLAALAVGALVLLVVGALRHAVG